MNFLNLIFNDDFHICFVSTKCNSSVDYVGPPSLRKDTENFDYFALRIP